MTDETGQDSRISLVLLLAIADKIVTEYAQRGLATVDLGDRQYYHAVATDEMFDMTRIPQDLVVGDLDDDISELKRLVHGDMPTAVDIERLGRVLLAISEGVLD